MTVSGNALQIALLLALVSYSSAMPGAERFVEPLFGNSVVSTEFDFISTDDPSAFKSITFVGRGKREMPDKRTEQLFDETAFIYHAHFDDRTIEVWAHSSFNETEIAGKYVSMLANALGKLPEILRKKLSRVVVHKGDETAFAEDRGNFFVLYSKNMERRSKSRDLEETVFHESVHATLDIKYAKSRAWIESQQKDNNFITQYAADNPAKEDLAESSLFIYTMIKYPGRLPAYVERWLNRHIPNRVTFIRNVFR